MIALLAASVWAAGPPELPQPWDVTRRRARYLRTPLVGVASYDERWLLLDPSAAGPEEAIGEVVLRPLAQPGAWIVETARRPQDANATSIGGMPLLSYGDGSLHGYEKWTATGEGIAIDGQTTEPWGIVAEPLAHLHVAPPPDGVRPGDVWTLPEATFRSEDHGITHIWSLRGEGRFEGWIRARRARFALLTITLELDTAGDYPARERVVTHVVVDPADGHAAWLASLHEILYEGEAEPMYTRIVRRRVDPPLSDPP